jgi:hypothetical protein
MSCRLPSCAPRAARIRYFALLLPALMIAPSLLAQNSIQLFGPVDKRLSTAGTGFGSNANNFNSTTLNLTCPAEPITAILSSTADGTGNVVVDNFLDVTSTAGTITTGPTNVCPGGGLDSCYTAGYLAAPSGADPDTFASTGGVAPISISQFLVPGAVQLQIALQDVGSGPGFYLAGSSIYLDTNCSQNGVTGPALVTGNGIPASGATPDELAQDFTFNPLANQSIGFEYDLTDAQTAGSLTVADGTIPEVSDSPIDPATFQSTYLPGTSFATANCLVHTGELLPDGQPACKLFTLQCAVGTSAASGAQCPISTQSNELFQDVFNGPNFTLPDIPTPGGPTFHEGIGFLMASDGWAGGPCTYEAAADLPNLPCPQNLLTSFSSSAVPSSNVRRSGSISPLSRATSKQDTGDALSFTPNASGASSTSSDTYTSSGRTTHPNSTFITVAQVPEDLTTVTVAGQQPGYWIKSSTANFTLSSQPPTLALTTLPGAANFVASPIQSITYGISPAGSVPAPGVPVPTDTTLSSSVVCPTLANPTGIPAAVFTPSQQTLTGLADGNYLLHYYAADCAGTEELDFIQDSSGNWSTSFYTYPINVDTHPPVVASGPTLSPAASAQGTYLVGQTVAASFSCTDALSGVTQCGSYKYAPGATNSTGVLTSPVDTSSPGSKTFTVQAVDAAGNQSSASVNYQVVSSSYDNQVQFTVNPQTVNYPQGVSLTVQIVPSATPALVAHGAKERSSVATRTVKILDGSKLLDTLRLQGNGAAYDYLSGFGAGKHILTAVYSGDGTIPAGTSAPVTLTVNPAPVTLEVYCWNSSFPYGADYYCGAYTSSNAGPAQGVVTYKYDNAAPVTVPLTWGVALFTISKPPVGSHTVVVSYAAQTNYAAAGPQAEKFTVTPAPVNVGFTPSAWYLTGGSLTLTASVQSWSAGPPKSTGAVTFTDGSKVLGVVPVDPNGRASVTVAASALSNGTHTFFAAYSGGTNYAAGQASVVVVVAHH